MGQTIPVPDQDMSGCPTPTFFSDEERAAVQAAIRLQIDFHRDNAAMFTRIANRYERALNFPMQRVALNNAAGEESAIRTLESALFQINPDA